MDEAFLDTVRLAREFGDVSQLLPAGVEHVRDLPHTLFEAYRVALMFLSFDELPEDERPPRRIWHDGEALREHFEAVKRSRRREAEGHGSTRIEDPVDNQAAKELIVGG
jgi:hypothetical protein